jgi:hypothetical protein
MRGATSQLPTSMIPTTPLQQRMRRHVSHAGPRGNYTSN